MSCEFQWREPTADEDIPEYAVLNSDEAWMVLQVRYPTFIYCGDEDGTTWAADVMGEWQDIEISHD